jgi:hypothetical protein
MEVIVRFELFHMCFDIDKAFSDGRTLLLAGFSASCNGDE